MCSADTSPLSFPARFSQLWWINTSLSVLRHPRTHGTKNHYRKFFFFLSCSWLYPTLCDFLLIQRVNLHSGSVASFNTGKNTFLQKKKKDNKNPWWDSNFTLACLKVWEEAAKRHSRRQNSQQANVQIKKWEIRNTNVQRIGWNRLWNWVLNREKGPQNAPKHWRAAASGTAITRSPVWDGTEEIRKTSHHWSKWNV